MPHQLNTNFAWTWIDQPESAQAGHSLPAHRNALGPATHVSARRGQDGAAVEVRILRELCHDLTIPATAIRLLASVAVKESDLDPSVKTRLLQIADEAPRIADICGYFLGPSPSAPAADLR